MNEKTNEKEAGVELRLQDLLMACLRQWKLIVICVLIGSTIAWGVTFFCMTPMYQATATLYVNNNSSGNDKQNMSSSDVTASIYLIQSYMVLVTSDVILEEVADELGGYYTPGVLSGAITTSNIETTMLFSIHVSHTDPYEAERITNALAKVVQDNGPDVFKGTYAQIIDTAHVPSGPYSPSYITNIITGAAAGVLLAVVYIAIMFLKDTRIKDENDLTDMFNLPILGRIPDFNDAVTGTRYAETETEGEEEA